jgi:hypothetical protein
MLPWFFTGMASCYQTLQGRGGNGLRIDHLPIIVSSPDIEFEKLQAVPKLPSGTGTAMAKEVVRIIRDWKLDECVEALSFDMTVSNTGIHLGCCQQIEVEFGRPLLHLACRHHIMKLLLAGVFKALVPASSGRDIQLFKRLRDQWSIIPKNNLQPFLDPRVDEYKDWRDATIASED